MNPVRLFDDKRAEVREVMLAAPRLRDYLSDESRTHFEQVKGFLHGVGIEFTVNPRMVRGLDYYTGTTFEFVHELLGAQSGIGGGGRYDGLMEQLGGQPVSGIGFGLGIDRALLAVEAEGLLERGASTTDLFIIPLGTPAKSVALSLSDELRTHDLTVEISFGDRPLKSAMKNADKSRAGYVLVLGDSELASGRVELKEMRTGATRSVSLSSLVSTITAELLTW